MNRHPPLNGAVSIFSSVLCKVVSSTTEAKLAALFHNGKEACPMQIALEEKGHPKPPTPIVTNNQTASGIANDDVRQKRPKAIDLRFCMSKTKVKIISIS